jgi:hypothetical protein
VYGLSGIDAFHEWDWEYMILIHGVKHFCASSTVIF